MTIKQSFHPICKQSDLVGVCLSVGMDLSSTATGIYSLDYIPATGYINAITDATTATGTNIGTFYVSHPLNNATGYYQMVDMSDQIPTNNTIPANSALFATFKSANSGYDVTDIMMTLCFQTDQLFFLNNTALQVGLWSGANGADSVQVDLINYPGTDPSIFPFYRDSIVGSTPWTVAFWFSSNNISGSNNFLWFFGQYTGSLVAGQSIFIEYDTSITTLNLHIGHNSAADTGTRNINFTMSNDTWYFCAITFNGSSGIAVPTDYELYINECGQWSPKPYGIDGIVEGGGNITYQQNSNNNDMKLIFGAPFSGSSTSLQIVEGYRTQLLQWNKKLTSAQLEIVHNQGKPVNVFELDVPRPMDWWSFQNNLSNNISGRPDLCFNITDRDTGAVNHFVNYNEIAAGKPC